MFCEHCDSPIELDFFFCPGCGTELDREEVIITHYFGRGFEYDKIILMLAKFHEMNMSLRTLKTKLKSFGLCRRSGNVDEELVRRRIREELDGAGCMGGYRSMWHTLRLEGIFVPRQVVERLVREMDPEGCNLRSSRRLTRRRYVSNGPNFCWHIDGYDKLKPYGFPIHGCIDGCSRKILWLKVSRTNNDPRVVARFFLEAVNKFGGCPRKVRSDCGTENGIISAMQSYFRNDETAHVYGSSPHNQRIEGWWSFFRRSRSTWWINFFKDLIEREIYIPGNELQEACLWFSFARILQRDLDKVRIHWNTHYIRQSRFDTISGRPDELYYIPECYGAEDGIEQVSQQQCDQVADECHTNDEDTDDFQEYFEYVICNNELQSPTTWREALGLYNTLQQCAQG